MSELEERIEQRLAELYAHLDANVRHFIASRIGALFREELDAALERQRAEFAAALEPLREAMEPLVVPITGDEDDVATLRQARSVMHAVIELLASIPSKETE